jgi:hypothetical protein
MWLAFQRDDEVYRIIAAALFVHQFSEFHNGKYGLDFVQNNYYLDLA